MTKKNEPTAVEARFAEVVKALNNDSDVAYGGGKGFGSGALKVNGKIFAMISSNGRFVVKLPQGRVDELVKRGSGERFDAGRGRKMKEWLSVPAKSSDWISLAHEACKFVKAGDGTKASARR